MSPKTVHGRTNKQGLLTIEVLREEGDTILVVCGEVDMATAPALWESVEEVLPDSKRVVIDLRAVDFLDSCGLAVFVRARRRLCGTGGALLLRSPNANVRRVLDLTGLSEVLTIES